jgi:hypothetical protein
MNIKLTSMHRSLLLVGVLVLSTFLPARSAFSQAALKPLFLMWNAEREDNFTTATDRGVSSGVGYSLARTEACVFSAQTFDTVPLELYWNPARGDNMTVSTAEGIQSAIDAGYEFVRVEGYVFSEPVAGTIPLELYWSALREDNFTTGTGTGSASAIDAGYEFVRVEGYAYPASECS